MDDEDSLCIEKKIVYLLIMILTCAVGIQGAFFALTEKYKEEAFWII